MRTSNRRVHRNVPVDQPGRVRLRQQRLQHPVPGAITRVTTVPFPYRLPRTELTPRQIAPRHTRTEPIDDPIHHTTIITERVPPPPRIGGQQRADQRPLRICQTASTRINS